MKTARILSRTLPLFFFLPLFSPLPMAFGETGEGAINFAIDIDDTLYYRLAFTPEEAKTVGGTFAQDGDHLSRQTDGAGEFIAALKNIPRARLSIVSSRIPERIAPLMKTLILPDGTTAYDAVQATNGGFYSRDDLSDTSLAENKHLQSDVQHFSGMRKKPLTIVLRPGDSLDEAFLIDDDLSYAAKGEERNVVRVNYKEYGMEFVADPTELAEQFRGRSKEKGGKVDKHYAQDLSDVVHDRNKLVQALGLIMRSLDRAKSESISPVEALWRLQWMKDPTGYLLVNLEETRSRATYQAGLRAFLEVNPKFKRTLIRTSMECHSLFNDLQN